VNPRQPDVDVVQRRLRALADAVNDLGRLRDIDAAALRADSILRAAAERLIQVAVDLAVDVNGHLATAELGRAPTTGRESFLAAAEAGIVSTELAEQLAPAAGLRNVLVHRYIDIDVDLVAGAVAETLELMPQYIDAVGRFLRSALD
jgi:uncharacterized protein YutE (UPF0331/DUF86 family)